MRSLSRAAVIGALALPLALGGAATAFACAGHEAEGHQHGIEVSDDDMGAINTGISHTYSFTK